MREHLPTYYYLRRDFATWQGYRAPLTACFVTKNEVKNTKDIRQSQTISQHKQHLVWERGRRLVLEERERDVRGGWEGGVWWGSMTGQEWNRLSGHDWIPLIGFSVLVKS